MGRNDRRQQRCPCALLDRGCSGGPSTARKEYEGHYRRTWRNKGFGHTWQSGVLFPLVVPLAWSRHTGSASRPRFRYLITPTFPCTVYRQGVVLPVSVRGVEHRVLIEVYHQDPNGHHRSELTGMFLAIRNRYGFIIRIQRDSVKLGYPF